MHSYGVPPSPAQVSHADVAASSRSVAERVKAPYPAILDPSYAVQLQRHAHKYLATPGHPVFELVTWEWVANAVTLDVARITQTTRSGLERVLELAQWLDLYRPIPKFS
jgi:asparagine synthase (glutamine-hydrolysing)